MSTKFPSSNNLLSLALALLAGAGISRAADVTMTASDAFGDSSLVTAGKWSDGQPPSSANDYFTGPYFIRTPADSGGVTTTFAGHSLTLNQPAPGGARSIIFKGGNGDVIVINNLTNALGGILENGGSGNATVTYTGNQFTIAANSAVDANQGPLIVGYPLVGPEGVILTNAGGNVITYSNDNSGFKGKFYTSTDNFGNGGGNTTIVLAAPNSAPGNPSVFTPDQIALQGGTLQDNYGLTLNNPNSGITLLANASINANATTVLAEPITDNGGGFTMTFGGTGTLILSNANNNWSGGTVIAGNVKLGIANALPEGDVTVNGTLDLNGFDITVGALNGAGGLDTFSGGTLTVGSGDASGTLNGPVANSVGTLSLTKIGSGTETLAGGYSYSGTTRVDGGTLNVSTANGIVPASPGDLVVSNGAAFGVDSALGFALPVNNLTVGASSTLTVKPGIATDGIVANGTLTLQDNSTLNVDYGTVMSNPSGAAVNAAGAISAPGANITIAVSGIGLQPGTLTLVRYGGTALSDLSNFQLQLAPGIFGNLVNNTANHTIDLNVTAVAKQLTWFGGNGNSWDLATANWKDSIGADVAYQQYTNGATIAGDGVTFDDTLDFSTSPQTNINLTKMFSPYPVVVNSTQPYSFGGPGGITGPTSLLVTNTGSLTITTSNSFTGGVSVNGGTLIVSSDSALGASDVGVNLNGGTLGFSGNTTSTRPINTTGSSTLNVSSGATAQLGGDITAGGALAKTGAGTLALTATNSVNGVLSVNAGTVNVSDGILRFTGNPSYIAYLTGTAALNLSGAGVLDSAGELRVGGSDQNGATYDATGTLTMSGGTANLSALTIARGNNNQNSVSGEVDISGGTMTSTNDVLIGFAGTGKGTLKISGTGTLNVGTTTTKWLRFGQWDSTSGEIDISGGHLNLNQGTSIKFNQNNSTGPKTFNQDGGTVTFFSDFATTPGGGGNIDLMLNSGSSTTTNTYNLNGGTLTVPQITSSKTTGGRIFNFNGGTLKATAANPNFFNLGGDGGTANVRNGGAIIDDGGFSITFAQALVHSTIDGDNATDGGLTKNGTGTVTLNGANTYTGPTTVNGGALLISAASSLSGTETVADKGTLSIVQTGGTTNKIGNLTLNGSGSVSGATLGVALTADNDPNMPFVNCGTLTLNGANTLSMAGAIKVGTIKLVRATGAVSGSGSLTNLVLPQGAQGTISVDFDGTYTTVSAVITSTGPGLTWAGGDNNLWDINTSTNWLLNSTPTTYQQTIVPGDAVRFNDAGSGAVTLNSSVGPASLVISNNSTAYTFDGSGTITGPADLKKLGSGTVTMNLANSYAGDTVVSNGTLQLGNTTAIPSGGNVILGPSGTVQLAGNSISLGDFAGSGTIDNTSGQSSILTFGKGNDVTWNGNIAYHGGGVELHKNGSGTLVLGGANHLDGGQPFNDQILLSDGTVIITNGGLLSVGELQLRIGDVDGQTANVVVDGGALAVTNNVLSVGYGASNAVGTLTVNSGTVFHGGPGGGAFAAVGNSIDVGAQGANGTLTVNGGQVLNNSLIYLGDGTGANGTLRLNGGLLQSAAIQPNGTPNSSVAYFNGGTLQAVSNSADFFGLGTTTYIQSGGLILDDGGNVVTIASAGLQDDPSSTGGPFIKKGSGAVYLNGINPFTGTTLVTNGLLAGVGSLTGPVVVAPGGAIGAGDAGAAIGTPFTIANTLTLQGTATFRISKDGGFAQNDQITGLTTVNYGGTLVVSNATSDGTALVAGDTFTLFSASTGNGNFANIVGSPGSGLHYEFNPANGQLSVKTGSGLPSTPTNVTFSVSGGNLTLSWPESYTGWVLQVQTNSLADGIGNNWVDVAGSTTTNSVSEPISSEMPTIFYRLRHP